MIKFFQKFDCRTELLINSFNRINLCGINIFTDDDGFLPNNSESAFSFFTKMYEMRKSGTPLYFNQLPVAKFWEIKNQNHYGEVLDKMQLKARINYSKKHDSKIIKSVEWLNINNKVIFLDHYNKFGFRYAQTVFGVNNKAIQKLWFGADDNKIVITQNYLTGDILLNDDGKECLFHNLYDFYLYYFYKRKYEVEMILFNSLDFPYFFTSKLFCDFELNRFNFLFWQEKSEKISMDNIKHILNSKDRCVKKIFVQNHDNYIKIKDIDNIFTYIGYIYPFKKQSKDFSNVLILSNTDQILHIENIVKYCRGITFHIASITGMSNTLLSLDKYDNVELYPSSSPKVFDSLFKKCGIYLDINKYKEIYDAVYKAFLHKQIIFSFKDTIHNSMFVSKDCIFDQSKWKDLCEVILKIKVDKALYNKMVKKQLKTASNETTYSFNKKISKYIFL